MDKIWVETLERLDNHEKRIKHIEGLTFPHVLSSEPEPESESEKPQE